MNFLLNRRKNHLYPIGGHRYNAIPLFVTQGILQQAAQAQVTTTVPVICIPEYAANLDWGGDDNYDFEDFNQEELLEPLTSLSLEPEDLEPVDFNLDDLTFDEIYGGKRVIERSLQRKKLAEVIKFPIMNIDVRDTF